MQNPFRRYYPTSHNAFHATWAGWAPILGSKSPPKACGTDSPILAPMTGRSLEVLWKTFMWQLACTWSVKLTRNNPDPPKASGLELKTAVELMTAHDSIRSRVGNHQSGIELDAYFLPKIGFQNLDSYVSVDVRHMLRQLERLIESSVMKISRVCSNRAMALMLTAILFA